MKALRQSIFFILFSTISSAQLIQAPITVTSKSADIKLSNYLFHLYGGIELKSENLQVTAEENSLQYDCDFKNIIKLDICRNVKVTVNNNFYAHFDSLTYIPQKNDFTATIHGSKMLFRFTNRSGQYIISALKSSASISPNTINISGDMFFKCKNLSMTFTSGTIHYTKSQINKIIISSKIWFLYKGIIGCADKGFFNPINKSVTLNKNVKLLDSKNNILKGGRVVLNLSNNSFSVHDTISGDISL